MDEPVVTGTDRPDPPGQTERPNRVPTLQDRPDRTSRTESSWRAGSWWRPGLRLIRYRLVIPVLRSSHPPEHTARGVAIGLAWAMTPLVGIQMMLVALTWVVASRLFRWHFSLVLGLAWTWITNAFTILPFYYAYYVTGQILLGHWGDLTGFDTFVGLWHGTFAADIGFWTALGRYIVELVEGWGVPLAVGSIPWVIVSAASGYMISLRVSRRRAAARAERKAQAARRRALREKTEHTEDATTATTATTVMGKTANILDPN